MFCIGENMDTQLFQGDCLELLKDIPDGSVDMILCDLPFGTTKNNWDIKLPLDVLREQYLRVLKENGAICLFTDQPFTADVIQAFRDIYRYELVWVIEHGTDFLNANRKPLKKHQTIQVLYRKQPVFNKQWTYGKPYFAPKCNQYSSNYGKFHSVQNHSPDGRRNPTTVLEFKRERGFHPTQKPVPLLEWLIKTYTDEGETVLDNCMGSGSTGVACVNTNRNFIGMELNPDYFQVAKSRIKEKKSGGNGNQLCLL